MVLRKTIYGTFFENVSLSDNRMHNLFSILNHEIHWDIVRSQGLKWLPMMSCRGRNDMLRRKLFAFGISFSLGIYSGYLFRDKMNLPGAMAVALSCILALLLLARSGEIEPGDVANILLWAVAGVLVISWNGYILDSYGRELVHGENADRETRLVGRIVDVRKGDSSWSFTVKDKNGGRSQIRVSNEDIEEYTEGQDNLLSLAGRKCIAAGKFQLPQPATNPGIFDYRLYLRSRGISAESKVRRLRFQGTSGTRNGSPDSSKGHNDGPGSYSDTLVILGGQDSRKNPGKGALFFLETIGIAGAINTIKEFPEKLLWKERSFMVAQRVKFVEAFERTAESKGVLNGILFGDKSDLDKQVYKEFTENNTAHVLTVSGLHMGFLYGALMFITGKKRNRQVTWMIWIVLTAYGEITMWSTSTIRAWLIISLSMLSFFVKKPFDLLSALSFSAVVMLAWRPYLLFNGGFIMSYLAMLGISFLSVPMGHFFGKYLGGAASVQGGMLPYVSYSYNMVDPFSLFINMPVIALASVVAPAAILVLVFLCLTGYVPPLLVFIIDSLCQLLVKVNHLLSAGGRHSFVVPSMSAGVLVCVYFVCFFLTSELVTVMVIRRQWNRIVVTAAILLIPVLALAWTMRNPMAGDQLIFADVGQGDCVHIRTERGNYLIDGGGDRFRNVGEETLRPYLLKNGCERIDVSFITHLHQDHCKGVEELRKIYPVGSTAISSEYQGESFDTVKDVKKLLYLSAGDRVSIGKNSTIQVIWPLKGESGGRQADRGGLLDEKNEMNMVMIVNIDGRKIMVTGDLLEEDEKAMIKYYGNSGLLKCHVLKAGHHGSRTSTSPEFLDAVDPEIVVIQVGRNNIYGHPHRQVVRRIESRGIKIYRTDVQGAVGMRIRKNHIQVHTMIRQSPKEGNTDVI